MSKRTIGETLKQARKSKGYSQAYVANELSCDRAVISRMETGKYQGALLLLERYINLMEFELTIAPAIKQRPTLDELGDLYD